MTNTQDWQSFWQQASSQGKDDSGIRDAALQQLWADWLGAELKRRPAPVRALDLACGDGALSRQLMTIAGDRALELTCVDIADAALAALAKHLPGAHTVVASAAATGLDAGSFDMVISQFGVEYAGSEALNEVVRLLAPGGSLALLQHKKGSAIDAESAAAVEAITRTLESGLLASFRSLLERARALQLGEGTMESCEEADRDLGPRVAQVAGLLKDSAPNPASEVILKMYRDVARIYQNMGHYAPTEVIPWTHTVESELRAFAGRMSSMVEAALSEEALRANGQRLEAAGLGLVRCEGVALSDGRDGAWLTVAQLPG
ncbi:class I SAM-dependent methyltransferase [Parahaliea maris]|uniref:Class I SAM-dependent methyltransferase n=1 Tax=Parahaliea maris TaxID=2716870 RepID=A0A5C8ZTA9_9GAMM|nr:class I SAM-dependent methyltransferase [Parahaliea maris]TXS90687.1 class I SAM-dependent methyltransferase [Parahaliea maris]